MKSKFKRISAKKAAILGGVNYRTLCQAIRENRVNHSCQGSRYFVSLADLEDAIERGTLCPAKWQNS